MVQPSERQKQLFHAALELPGDGRAAFLAKACGEDVGLHARVLALLAAHSDASRFLAESALPRVAAEPAAEAGSELRPDRVGRYHLQERIGEGGFGTVWMAEQLAPVRRQVAVKILKPGLHTQSVVARFEQERQALALMEHTNIARVLDGGETTDGWPFFAMELVRGVPITRFCDEQRSTTTERLHLFRQVCHAVHHAHQKGIIHRDLKPANILVALHDGVPVPKVIDFGIAKAIGQPLGEKAFTEFRQLLGTPEYMAPEQAESVLDIDTRSDIYSLGVVLYELLTGTLPFDFKTSACSYEEVLRVLREQDPPKPSTRISTLNGRGSDVAGRRRLEKHQLTRLLRCDLDWIVMRALEKDRNRRYESADAFAADVQRHLQHEPVAAAAPGRLYCLKKYVRRHRAAVTAGALVAASLVVGLTAALYGLLDASEQRDLAKGETRRANEAAAVATEQQRRADAQRIRAEDERTRAEAGEASARKEALRARTVINFVAEMLSSADPYGDKGRDYKVRELLDDFDRGLIEQLRDEPDVEATVRRLMGIAYMSLGLHDKAEPHVNAALATRRQLLGDEHALVAESLCTRADLLHGQGHYAEAQTVLEAAMAIVVKLPDGETPLMCDILTSQSHMALHLRAFAQAEQRAQQARALGRRLLGGRHLDVVSSQTQVARVWAAQDRFVEAESAQREALDLLREALGERHPKIAEERAKLGAYRMRLGKYAEAEGTYREALDLAQQLFGEEHWFIARTLDHLGLALLDQGKHEAAEEMIRRGLAMRQKLHGDVHPVLASSINSLGVVLHEREQFSEAEALFRRALALLGDEYPNVDASLGNLDIVSYREAGGEAHASIAATLNYLGNALLAQGKHKAAEEIFRRVLAMRQKSLGEGEEDLDLATSLDSLGRVLRRRRLHSEADALFRRALAIRQRTLGDEHPKVATSLNNLGVGLYEQDNFEQAEAMHTKALAMRKKLSGTHHPSVAQSLNNLASVYLGMGKLSEGEALKRQALAIQQQLWGSEHVEVATSMTNLGVVLRGQKKFDEAEALLREALRVRIQLLGEDHPNVALGLLSLALLLYDRGQWAEAERLQRQGVELRRRLLGNEHPDVVDSLMALVLMLLSQDKAEEAEGVCREALALARSTFGDVHPRVAGGLGGLGNILRRGRRFAEAESAYREALAVRQQLGDEPRTLITVVSLGAVLREQGKHAEAEPVLRQALEMARRQHPEGDLEIANHALNLGESILEQHKFVEAEPPLRECLAIREQKLRGDWRHYNAMSLLGAALAGQGKHEAAEPLLREGYAQMQPPAASAVRKREALERLIKHYDDWGKSEQAAQWRQLLENKPGGGK